MKHFNANDLIESCSAILHEGDLETAFGEVTSAPARKIQTSISDRQNTFKAQQDAFKTKQDAFKAEQDAFKIRQDAIKARQDATGARQAATQTSQDATEHHRVMLQETNERLVIANIEAKILAEQLQITQAHLINAKFAADKANRAKSEFLSNMSHELRTPLNTILGFSQLLESGSPPPTTIQASRLKKIREAGWYLLELINETLDMATIESGKLAMSLESIVLAEVMLECQTIVGLQAQQHSIELKFIPFDNSLLVLADRIRLKQVLINLLSNAIKYNNKNGQVEVTCSASIERIRINIKDSGEGLGQEKLTQLFQPFNRLGHEQSDTEGTGIGLVFSKKLIEVMNGSIGVKSILGVGSEFWIELTRDTSPPPLTRTNLTGTPL